MLCGHCRVKSACAAFVEANGFWVLLLAAMYSTLLLAFILPVRSQDYYASGPVYGSQVNTDAVSSGATAAVGSRRQRKSRSCPRPWHMALQARSWNKRGWPEIVMCLTVPVHSSTGNSQVGHV